MVTFVSAIRKIAQDYVRKLSNVTKGRRKRGTKKNAKKSKKKRKGKKRTRSSESIGEQVDLPEAIDLTNYDASSESETEVDNFADYSSETDCAIGTSSSESSDDGDRFNCAFEPAIVNDSDALDGAAGDGAEFSALV